MKRLPILSLAAGMVVCVVMLVAALAGWKIPAYGLATLGVLPLAAAIGDVVRFEKFGGAGQGTANELTAPQELDDQELRAWLEDKVATIASREQTLNAQALALQQWMQFPDAIAFDPADGPVRQREEEVRLDPMARHDEALFGLIETKTHELFDSIREDTYRKQEGDKKSFNTARIRGDLITLVEDVAAIYRPDETNPLLKTNVEALSRATGRAALRFLVAVEGLPGGIAAYDFQSIYTIVSRAVSTYGMYQSAKPYIDVASNVLFAGRIVSSTNPVTLAAWWAAGKAATYGASKLGKHVIDQQAVGLLRQLVEIVAIEVASLYSPMVRYRDVHWVYGVELVHLASELALPAKSRLEIMNQLSALSLRDEYARVSLMRQAAAGKSSRPAQYAPAQSLAPVQRMAVAEQLESFLLAHVLKEGTVDRVTIDRWQTETAERLEIQLRAGATVVSETEQVERCIWALASFALEHLADEAEDLMERLKPTQCWGLAPTESVSQWTERLKSEPPYLYHPPQIDPESKVCELYLDDLVRLASDSVRRDRVPIEPKVGKSDISEWKGREALRITAYFLRSSVKEYEDRWRRARIGRLLRQEDQAATALSQRGVLEAIESLFDGERLDCLYLGATFESNGASIESACVAVRGPTCVCFSVAHDADDGIRLTVHAVADYTSVATEKIAGYVRSDCRLRFPDSSKATIAGSSLRGYEAYFDPLLKSN
ncbi:MAG: hypothetical protein AAFU85_07990 [Planctomycetota bacterium]